MGLSFDDSRLDDPAALGSMDSHLRHLASAGARVRVANDAMRSAAAESFEAGRGPRGVIALGAEARLVRVLLEPVCPVPFVAWPIDGLPGWVGPLDLVVVLASEGSEPDLMSAVGEAVRRGAAVVVAANPDSPIADQAASRNTLVLPTRMGDPLATVVVVLEVLHGLGLGPAVSSQAVADTADQVAQQCAGPLDISKNPAKELALALAEAQPLVWGGTVLAARAARRVAEAFRRASGRPALAADSDALLPVLASCRPRDTFADPFDESTPTLAPVLVVLDDRSDDERVRRERGQLVSVAERQGVRVFRVPVEHAGESDLERYVELLQRGLFAAAYLGLGLVDDEDAERR